MLMLRDRNSAICHQRPFFYNQIQANEEKHQTKEIQVVCRCGPCEELRVSRRVVHLPASHSCANVAFAGNKHLKIKL